MALGYIHSIVPLQLIGTKTSALAITGNLLTSAYGGSGNTKVFNTANISKINLSIKFTLGSAETNNILHLRIRTSADATNFYQTQNVSVSGGTATLSAAEFQFTGAATASGPYLISLPYDVSDLWTEVAVYESGVSSNYGNTYVEATLGGTLK